MVTTIGEGCGGVFSGAEKERAPLLGRRGLWVVWGLWEVW